MDQAEFLVKRRNRAIATILGFKDRECAEYLPDDVSEALRKVILDQVNELCDVALDLLNTTASWNGVFLDRLEEIHEALTKE